MNIQNMYNCTLDSLRGYNCNSSPTQTNCPIPSSTVRTSCKEASSSLSPTLSNSTMGRRPRPSINAGEK